MLIKINEIIGTRCLIQEDGQKVFDLISTPLKNKEKVILDFKGVSQFASPFFNFAIGQLLKVITENEINKQLEFNNLNTTGEIVKKKVIENALKYHEDKNYQKIVDDILKEQESDL